MNIITGPYILTRSIKSFTDIIMANLRFSFLNAFKFSTIFFMNALFSKPNTIDTENASDQTAINTPTLLLNIY